HAANGLGNRCSIHLSYRGVEPARCAPVAANSTSSGAPRALCSCLRAVGPLGRATGVPRGRRWATALPAASGFRPSIHDQIRDGPALEMLEPVEESKADEK